MCAASSNSVIGTVGLGAIAQNRSDRAHHGMAAHMSRASSPSIGPSGRFCEAI